MQTRHPGPEAAEERLDWFTYDILPDGQQICAIRLERTTDPGQRLILNRNDSKLLQLLLNEIAQDHAVPYAETRQAILRAIYRAHCATQRTH